VPHTIGENRKMNRLLSRSDVWIIGYDKDLNPCLKPWLLL